MLHSNGGLIVIHLFRCERGKFWDIHYFEMNPDQLDSCGKTCIQLLAFVAEKPGLPARNQRSPVLRESWGQPEERTAGVRKACRDASDVVATYIIFFENADAKLGEPKILDSSWIFFRWGLSLRLINHEISWQDLGRDYHRIWWNSSWWNSSWSKGV